MEVVSQVQRRKACDLCFTKKIKCDMLKPACSNCQLYKAECRTTAVRRRIPNPRERDPPVPPQVPAQTQTPAVGGSTEGADRTKALEDRLARIEAQLQQVIAVASAAVGSGGKAPQSESAVPDLTFGPSPMLDFQTQASSTVDPELSGLDTILGQLSPQADWVFGEPDSPYKLPPIQEILPRIESYFINFNSVIPLFEQTSFMRMLHDYYNSRSAAIEESRYAIWAAVNIVIALSYRVPIEPIQANARHHEYFTENDKVSKCLQNAQSVLNELVTREQDLLGLQVLLGMVILFQSTRDHRPGPVLIGTAVRLAHRMKLESRMTHQLVTFEQAQQHTRVFWIAYFLDKDISLRHQIPFIQQDNDIDVDLPPMTPSDGAGDLYTLDGRVRMNYFRARVQLASIEGRIYDAMYSTRSTRMVPEQRRQHITKLENMLEDWRRSIPPELQLEHVLNNVGRVDLTHMASLHHAYLMCLVMTHGIYSHSAAWIRAINQYSRVQLIEAEYPRGRCTSQQPPRPLSWEKCVSVSRECLRIMERMSDLDCSMWLNGCAFVSALIIILVHMYEAPRLETVELDRRITRHGLQLFRQMKDATKLIPLDRLHVVIEELNRRAMETLEATAEETAASAQTGSSGTDADSSNGGASAAGMPGMEQTNSSSEGGLSGFNALDDMDATELNWAFGDNEASGSPFDMGFVMLPKPFELVMDGQQSDNLFGDVMAGRYSG